MKKATVSYVCQKSGTIKQATLNYDTPAELRVKVKQFYGTQATYRAEGEARHA